MSWKGSPPRMRGKELRRCDPLGLCGITPAYAGKSYKAKACRLLWWDHPRVCGEKVLRTSWTCSTPGSPPRMRGKATMSPCRRPMMRDHPRVCGEKIHQLLPCRGARGSPPRMRGKGSGRKTMCQQIGITPAYAGKRGRTCLSQRQLWDHPRVCGEKTKKIP